MKKNNPCLTLLTTILLLTCLFSQVHAQEGQSLINTPGSEVKINRDVTKEAQFAIVRLKFFQKEEKLNVQLVQLLIEDGIIKNTMESLENGIPGDLAVFILNKDKKPVAEMLISNPLKVRYEYPNDDNTIGSKVVDLPENEILLRFNYTDDMKYIEIKKIEKDGLSESIKLIIITPSKN
jgi:hypothetical protein